MSEKKDSMNDIEYWRNKALDYEWMFKEQRNICNGYKEIIEELNIQIKKFNIEKAMRQQLVSKN
jgi:hypothetical protein